MPFFKKLIAEGAGELPITDERMTRFWITLEQGVSFVMSCMELMRGGEIFVPKIPSMRITDMARCMAPNLPHKSVGIRVGEKLHEVMISEDDARSTVEFADRYAILAAFLEARHGCFQDLDAVQVKPGFCYASDTNENWLDGEDLQHIMGEY
ncbi:MAG: hypothetical protein CMM47_11315 [Rhodospirillaceae bacterium]|nr:hypothetical protein [Rhodospirillaceae bacterium]